MKTTPDRDKIDQKVILECLDHIDEAIITLEKYQDVMSNEEIIVFMCLRNFHLEMDELVKKGTYKYLEGINGNNK